MALAFGFSRDVTALINSYQDWRYRLVRGGGQTPSASAMPLLVPPDDEPITQNMEHGKQYIQHLEFSNDDSESTMITIWQTCRIGYIMLTDRIRSFDCCTSDDVSPCDLVALCSTCDACEPYSLQLERTRF